MKQNAEEAAHEKTNTQKPAEQTSNQPTPDNEKYIAHILDVKGREFKISNADLKIGDIENHPATRIVFEDPHIEWLIYFLDGAYYNVLRDETGNVIIPTVKSKYPPWEDDNESKRDKNILTAFNLKGWKKTEAALIFNVVKAAYHNYNEIKNFLWLPQLQVIQADGKNNDQENKKISEYEYAEIIMRENHIFSNDGDEIFLYQNGVYRLDFKADLITKMYRKMVENNYTLSAERSIINQIIHESRIDFEKINSDPYIINFINGLYDLRTGELSSHTPDFISTIQVPHAFLLDAESDVIIDVIKGILHSDDIQTFIENSGYIMSLLTNLKKDGFIIGEADTGKTTLMEILQNLVGYENCSIESLDDVTRDKFSMIETKDKLLNCCDDITDRTIFNTDVIKKMSGGSRHGSGEKKNVQKVKFIKTCKSLYGGNKLPPTFQEEDVAYLKRWFIFYCSIVHKKDDPKTKDMKKIINSISEEDYSAFIKKCLDAFRIVMERGYFTLSKSNLDIQHKYRILSNPLGVFIDECTQPTDIEIKGLFLETYNKWAQKNNVSTMDSSTMGKKMGRGKFGLGYKDNRVSTDTRLYYWEEISLTDEARKEFIFEKKTNEKSGRELKDLKTPEIKVNPYDIKAEAFGEGM